MSTGHPRHQVRDFRITVKHPRHGRSVITSRAQTEHDALLRLGIALGNTYPDTGPAEWITLGVHDPAPFVWMPGESDAYKSYARPPGRGLSGIDRPAS